MSSKPSQPSFIFQNYSNEGLHFYRHTEYDNGDDPIEVEIPRKSQQGPNSEFFISRMCNSLRQCFSTQKKNSKMSHSNSESADSLVVNEKIYGESDDQKEDEKEVDTSIAVSHSNESASARLLPTDLLESQLPLFNNIVVNTEEVEESFTGSHEIVQRKHKPTSWPSNQQSGALKTDPNCRTTAWKSSAQLQTILEASELEDEVIIFDAANSATLIGKLCSYDESEEGGNHNKLSSNDISITNIDSSADSQPTATLVYIDSAVNTGDDYETIFAEGPDIQGTLMEKASSPPTPNQRDKITTKDQATSVNFYENYWKPSPLYRDVASEAFFSTSDSSESKDEKEAIHSSIAEDSVVFSNESHTDAYDAKEFQTQEEESNPSMTVVLESSHSDAMESAKREKPSPKTPATYFLELPRFLTHSDTNAEESEEIFREGIQHQQVVSPQKQIRRRSKKRSTSSSSGKRNKTTKEDQATSANTYLKYWESPPVCRKVSFEASYSIRKKRGVLRESRDPIKILDKYLPSAEMCAVVLSKSEILSRRKTSRDVMKEIISSIRQVTWTTLDVYSSQIKRIASTSPRIFSENLPALVLNILEQIAIPKSRIAAPAIGILRRLYEYSPEAMEQECEHVISTMFSKLGGPLFIDAEVMEILKMAVNNTKPTRACLALCKYGARNRMGVARSASAKCLCEAMKKLDLNEAIGDRTVAQRRLSSAIFDAATQFNFDSNTRARDSARDIFYILLPHPNFWTLYLQHVPEDQRSRVNRMLDDIRRVSK